MEKVYIMFEHNDYDNPYGKGPKLISVHKTEESAEQAQKERYSGEVNFIKEYRLYD